MADSDCYFSMWMKSQWLTREDNLEINYVFILRLINMDFKLIKICKLM